MHSIMNIEIARILCVEMRSVFVIIFSLLVERVENKIPIKSGFNWYIYGIVSLNCEAL